MGISIKQIWIVIAFIGVLFVASILAYQRSKADIEAVKGVEVSQITPSPVVEENIVSTITEVPMKNTETPKALSPKTYEKAPSMQLTAGKKYFAVMTTSKGVMRLVLDSIEAPVTVNNFVFLSREGFYNQTVFHRIINGFMIQGGDPKGDGTGGPGYRFADEKIVKEYTKGTIAMANAGPDTNGSQFFIMHKDYALPKNYVIFGRIDPSDSESMKTLDAIATVPTTMSITGEQSKPIEKVTVESVVVDEK